VLAPSVAEERTAGFADDKVNQPLIEPIAVASTVVAGGSSPAEHCALLLIPKASVQDTTPDQRPRLDKGNGDRIAAAMGTES
jgi:hypothetical protein